MLHPTIEELTQDKYNRYELALATAKCARIVTDEYVHQHENAERSQTGNRETDRPINQMIEKQLRDEKAVRIAIGRIYRGEYVIDEHADDPNYQPPEAAEEAAEEPAGEKAEPAAEGSPEAAAAEPAETDGEQA